MQAFGLVRESYQPLSVEGTGLWLEKAQLGLGLWQGNYQGINRQWLRWYDRDSQWMLTPAEQEKQRADLAAVEIARLKQILEQAGMNPNS